MAKTVEAELAKLAQSGEFTGKFSPQFHSYGYEGRSGLPSKFDATYCYILGLNVAALISLGQNGLISSVTDLTAPVDQWSCGEWDLISVPLLLVWTVFKKQSFPIICRALFSLFYFLF